MIAALILAAWSFIVVRFRKSARLQRAANWLLRRKRTVAHDAHTAEN